MAMESRLLFLHHLSGGYKGTRVRGWSLSNGHGRFCFGGRVRLRAGDFGAKLVKKSRVLDAFGVPDDVAARTIRVSMGWNTTPEELDAFAQAWRSLK